MRIVCFIIVILYSVILSAQERVTLLFVGDLMQHDAQIKAAHAQDGYDYADCFKHVRGEISEADIAVGNLEVTMGGKPYRGYPSFSAPDDFLLAVKEAGFDVLLTANNHCLDRGKRGLERTIQMLDSVGLHRVGTYTNRADRERHCPLLIEKNSIRIALLAYTYDTNGLTPSAPNMVNYIDKEQIKEDILRARRMLPDVIIACMHWGWSTTRFRLRPSVRWPIGSLRKEWIMSSARIRMSYNLWRCGLMLIRPPSIWWPIRWVTSSRTCREREAMVG